MNNQHQRFVVNRPGDIVVGAPTFIASSLIFTVLPFASMGGVIALYLSSEYLSVPVSIGFIALWGIAFLNGVVLVSYIRSLRQGGMDQKAGIVEGASLRFRPVMMTATVAPLGLVLSSSPKGLARRFSAHSPSSLAAI